MARLDVTTAASRLEFDTANGDYNSAVQIDANHFLNFWRGNADDGFVQVFTVNTTTWAVTTAAARLEYDTVDNSHNCSVQIDTNHFLNFWQGVGLDGFVQVFKVNTTTWAVATSAAKLEFDTQDNTFNSAVKIDTNHFINFWAGPGTDGFVQTFTVNTTTWAVTTAAASLEFDTQQGRYNSAAQIDDNHFINFWQDVDSDGKVQVFTVNTTTWAVTTSAALLEFDTQNNAYNSCVKIDTNHFLNVWSGGSNSYFLAQVFEVNTTTWVVSTSGALTNLDLNGTDSGGYEGRRIAKIDTTHFLVFYENGSQESFDGYTRVLEIDTSDWSIKLPTAALEFDTADAWRSSCVRIDTNHFINFWAGQGVDGFVQVFTVDLNYSPTVALNTPADAGSTGDTTPTLDFTGTDTETNDIRYNLELDDASNLGYSTPAFDLKSQGVGSGVASLNVSHTITGTNPLLVVIVHKDTTDAVTAVKWDGSSGTALTLIDKIDHPADVNIANVEMWYLKAPATGTKNVYVSFAGSVDFTVTVLSFTNMDQTAPLDVSAKISGGAVANITPTVYITPRIENTLIVDGGALNDTGVAMTPISGQTERSDFDGDWNRSFTSSRQATGLKTYTMGWTSASGATEWVLMAAAFKPYGNPILNEVSGTDSGFANPDTGGDTDPFNSGENIQFTVQGADELSTGTYYWRVRAIDPSGSNLYGSWSSTRSFTISGAVYSETYTETIVLVDSLLKTPNKILIETATIVDTLIKANARTLSDVVTIADSIIKGRDFTDAVTVVDSVIKGPDKVNSEAITIVDTIINATSRTLSEVVTVVDTVLKTGSRLFEEVITIVDSIIKGRDFTDVVTIVDSIIRDPVKVLSEAVTIVDTLIKAPSTILAEVMTIVDSVLKTPNKILSETVTIVDVLNSVIARTLTEVMTIVDSVLKTPNKVLSDVVTVVDEFTGKITNRTLSEAITIVDSVIKDSSRVFLEVVSLVDTVLKTPSRVFSEVITIADELIRTGGKVLVEVVTVVDSVVRVVSRTLSEELPIVDSIIKTSSRVFSESVSLVDTFLSQVSRTFSEVIPLVDTFLGNPGKELSEVITVVDSLVKSTNHVLTESITLVDSAIKEVGRIMIESVVLVDSIIKARSITLTDEIPIIDSVLKTSGKVLSESVTVVDTVVYVTGKIFIESITIVDDLFRGFRWYQRLSTAFRSILRTGWYDRNNTTVSTNNKTSWHNKNNTDWRND